MGVLCAGLSLGTFLPSCAVETGTTHDEDVQAIGQDLYFKTSVKWGAQIPVCWLTAGSATEKAWVKAAVAGSWSRYAKVDFTGWGSCPVCNGRCPNFVGIRVGIADTTPHTVGLGTELNMRIPGMALNFTFKNWSPSCAASASKREKCIRSIAVHEFGHALGFAHEQNRPDTPEWCNDPQGSNGNKLLGSWDVDSIMNYCNPTWNNGGILSAGDIAGVRAAYGAR